MQMQSNDYIVEILLPINQSYRELYIFFKSRL